MTGPAIYLLGSALFYHTMAARLPLAYLGGLVALVLVGWVAQTIHASGLLLGFGLLLWLEPGAFVSSSGADVEWQQLLYYSYVTLTTLGYGDIVPVGFHAQAFAAFEAIIGTLYTVILLSRLVGLHASRRLVTEPARTR